MGKYVTQNNLKRLGLENIKTFATPASSSTRSRCSRPTGKAENHPPARPPVSTPGTLITEADLQAGLKSTM